MVRLQEPPELVLDVPHLLGELRRPVVEDLLPDRGEDGAERDIIAALRTAFRGAHNFHDANYITFHRIVNLRDARYA